MKLLLPALALLSTVCAHAQSLQEYRNGAVAVLQAIDKGGDSLTRPQADDMLIFSTFHRGFLGGLSFSKLMIEGKPNYGQPEAEEWMWNPVDAAKSFLVFLKKHEPAGFDRSTVNTRDLHSVLFAWYLESHSRKSAKDQEMVSVIMKDVFVKPMKREVKKTVE